MKKVKTGCLLKSVTQCDQEVLDFISHLFIDITKEQWKWEFLSSPTGSIIKICNFDNKIIGHYSLITFPMLLSGTIISGAKAEGSLIDINAVRRLQKNDRNVFGKLVKSCLTEFSSFNKFAVFGFPNRQALPSQLKHGYKNIKINGYERIYIRDLSYIARDSNIYIRPFIFILAKLYKIFFDLAVSCFFRKFNFSKEMTEKDASDLSIFSFNLSKKNPDILMANRTYQYYKWRIIDNPYNTGNVLLSRDKDGEINALIAYSIEKNKYSSYVKIQDIAALDSKAGVSLFNNIFKIMKEENVNYLTLWDIDNYSTNKRFFYKFTPFIYRKIKISKDMIFYSNLFNDISLNNFDISLIYKRF
jgi:hypothetical protein